MAVHARLAAMNVALRKSMTRQDFLLWAEAQDQRFEFDGVQPVAMTAGTNNHGTISGNLNVQLALRLENSRCRPMSSDGGEVATTGDRVRSPEATVICSRIRGRDRLIPDPVIVFEVISESTRRIDQVEKLREYHAVASIKRTIIIEQTGAAVTVHARQSGEPWATVTYGAGDVLDLSEVGIQLPVDLLYGNVDFEDAESAEAAT